MAVKVLIVEDSPMTRDMLANLLSDEQGISIVGFATNGLEAVRMAKELRPDVISMDIRMPIMEGFEAIEIIMSENPVPILVVTDFDSSNTAFTSISKGALDIYPKKKIGEDNGGEYASRIRLLSKVKVIRHMKHGARIQPPARFEASKTGATREKTRQGRYDIVSIASSTGGPKALVAVLTELKDGLSVPVVIAQHMDDGFVGGFVEWLVSVTKLNAKVGSNGEILEPGTVYLAPPGKHMEVSPARRLAIQDRQPTDIYHPSCNRLLSSVAEVYGDKSIGVILTGMGEDGSEGLGNIQRKGGLTIGQDEKSCVVYGMPAAAANKGYVDKVLPLDEIGKAVSLALRERHDVEAAQK